MHRSALRTFVMLVTLLGLTGSASAERVLVLEPLGNADEDVRDDVQDALFAALRTLSFDGIGEGTEATDEHATPEDANDFRALADLQHAQWVLLAYVRPRTGGYEVRLRVAYAASSRVEELTFEVARAREADRLADVLRAMLRPEGLSSEDRMRLQGPDIAGNEAQAAADQAAAAQAAEARARAEREAAEQAERDAFEQRERERAEREERTTWENRERYGTPGRFSIMGGLGLHPVLNAPPEATGGAMGSFDFRFGFIPIQNFKGFEVRVGAQAFFGASGGLAIFGGAAYLVSPWQNTHVHLGATLELGMFYATTGNRVPSLLVRAGGMASWHVTEKLWLEAIVPTFNIFSANGGIVTLGLYVGVGTRF